MIKRSVLLVSAFVGILWMASGTHAAWNDAQIAAGRQPVTMADEPFYVKIWQSVDNSSAPPKYPGWFPQMCCRTIGHTRRGDAVIIEFSKAGKLLQSYRVGLEGVNPEAGEWCEDVEPPVDESKLITADGEITVTVKYYDDQEEKERVIGVRKLKVVKVPDHQGSGVHIWKYAILDEDVLGSNYVVMYQQDEVSIPTFWLYFWGRRENSNLEDVSVKIEVDGKRLELANDFIINTGDACGLEQTEEMWLNNDRRDNIYNFYKFNVILKIYSGPKRENVADGGWIGLIDHPGNWVLKVREQGKLAREFRFTVADGQIVPHPEQDASKPGYLNLGPNRYYLDMRFPNPDEFDVALDPAAIRAGMLFGRPWISDEVKNGMLKDLPPEKKAPLPFPSTTKLPK